MIIVKTVKQKGKKTHPFNFRTVIVYSLFGIVPLYVSIDYHMKQ